MSLLEVKNVKKIYTTRFGSNQVEALRDVNFTVERGEYVAIMGESGSGKTTLLNILAALDKPTEGKVYLKDRDLGKLKEKEIATFRRQNLGFVFQDFNLLDTFSLKDNIFLPLVLSGKKYSEMEKRLKPIAEKLGIEKLLEKYPYEAVSYTHLEESTGTWFRTDPYRTGYRVRLLLRTLYTVSYTHLVRGTDVIAWNREHLTHRAHSSYHQNFWCLSFSDSGDPDSAQKRYRK